MTNVSPKLQRAFLRAAHNGETRIMEQLLSKADDKHDKAYKKKIVGLPSNSMAFERKRLPRENNKVSRHTSRFNLISVVDHRMRRSALHWACKKGKFNAAKVALLHGIDPNAADINGQTALHIVCKHRTLGKLLFLLLDHGSKLDIIDSNGYTPLMTATVNGNIDFVKVLLMYGANIYTETKIGFKRKTVIDLADEKKQESILQLLLRYVYEHG